MRSPILPVLAFLAVAACQPTAPAGNVATGAIITDHDVRDTAQCTAQPKLPWCQSACKADDKRGWCDVSAR